MIKLEGLTKRYGYGDAENFALKDVDLEIKKGEFIMVMGPSGCGKTTLLNILGLLDNLTTGTYYLNGVPVNRMSKRKKANFRAKKIGLIFQNFNLVQDMAVVENVALPLVYSGLPKTRRLLKASEILKKFHLQEREYYLPYQLSGGQQQRVAIARSLVNQPEIILADEPTGNLDSKSAHIVMEELRAIHAEGNTIVMVTHNAELTTYATRVVKMLDGAIDEDVKTVDDRDLPGADKESGNRVGVKFLHTKPAVKTRPVGVPTGSLQAIKKEELIDEKELVGDDESSSKEVKGKLMTVNDEEAEEKRVMEKKTVEKKQKKATGSGKNKSKKVVSKKNKGKKGKGRGKK